MYRKVLWWKHRVESDGAFPAVGLSGKERVGFLGKDPYAGLQIHPLALQHSGELADKFQCFNSGQSHSHCFLNRNALQTGSASGCEMKSGLILVRKRWLQMKSSTES